MPKNKSLYRPYNIESHCNSLANQYLILVTIFAAIISQEIENDDDLGILASFLVALSDQLALASATRATCKATFEDECSLPAEIEDVSDRGFPIVDSTKKARKVKRKYVKKVKKTPNKQRL
jgi:hypothetical protein